MSPNISAPTQGGGDWTKWTSFMQAMVQHFEDRYTQAEVRQWYFEVWNEPSWMYSLGDDGYVELYRNTVSGLLQADPMVRVGGPAGSAGESPGMIQRMIQTSLSTATPVKLDFLTYHRYSDDNSQVAGEATDVIAFHKSLVNLVNGTTVAGAKFTGELINDEFGPSFMPHPYRDTEVAASFVAKTIVRLGTDTDTTAPTAYGYWALSDLYEENNMGTTTAYREGNYGMLLKGDPAIPESYDVAKPVFNSFRLLHMMGDQQLVVTGSAAGDGVGAGASRSTDGSKVQVLVYNHRDVGGDASTNNNVTLTVENLPFTGAVRVRRYIVDYTHANSYRPWLAMGRPARPTQAQWVTLRAAAELCYYDTTVQASAGSVAFAFPQNVYGVSLIELTSGG
jgi:xylan 1,4-beta-xylosidase